VSAYNYENFPQDMEISTFASFRHALRAGERAPDGEMIDAADGRSVRLSDCWRRGATVIEFGSIT